MFRKGDLAHTVYRVPGTPTAIPAGAPVLIEDVTITKGRRSKDRFGTWTKEPDRIRYKVNYAGHFYWVDPDALQ